MFHRLVVSGLWSVSIQLGILIDLKEILHFIDFSIHSVLGLCFSLLLCYCRKELLPDTFLSCEEIRS